jgi:hypothetical protein
VWRGVGALSARAWGQGTAMSFNGDDDSFLTAGGGSNSAGGKPATAGDGLCQV